MTVPRQTCEIFLSINGQQRTICAHPMERLLDVLRHQLALTGAKEGCGEGECGSCSVLLDGVLVNSCLVPILQASGTEITTIEGLAQGTRLHALQKAFLDCGGAQCGICTPGMVLAVITCSAGSRTPRTTRFANSLPATSVDALGTHRSLRQLRKQPNRPERKSEIGSSRIRIGCAR